MQPSTIQFAITPYESVGPLHFGMSAAQVREQLDSPDVAREPATPCDSFPELGIRVYYNVHGEAEAIELRGPAQPSLQGRLLLGQPHGPLENWFKTFDPNLKLEHSGLTSMETGIRLYAASARRVPSTRVEVATVFGRDYFRTYLASIVPPPP